MDFKVITVMVSMSNMIPRLRIEERTLEYESFFL